jgi:hypothetical protein
VGCNVVVLEMTCLLAIRLQSSNTLFSAARTSNSRCLVRYLVQRCDARVIQISFYFERRCPKQRPRAALKPQEPRPSGRPWTPGAAPAEVLASRGVAVVESWQVASRRSYLCSSREGGPHTSPAPPWDLLAITSTPGTGPKTFLFIPRPHSF